MTAPLPDRPRPLLAALRTVGMAVALVGSIVASLVGYGVLTATQGDAITGLLGALPGLVTLITALLSAFGVVKAGEKAVTPIADPAIDIDGTLTSLTPAPAGEHNPHPGDISVTELIAREQPAE